MKINNKPAEKKVVQMNYLFFCPELRNVGYDISQARKKYLVLIDKIVDKVAKVGLSLLLLLLSE